MKLPDFFIIGAPKCGTTALSAYLSKHPQVFFSNPKEPHFFATDFPEHRGTKDLNSYQKLFKDVTSQHKRVGEGSVYYLYSNEALTNIKQICNDAKLIVMLRDPVDMSHSMHQQYLHALYEDEPDFEKAWQLQEARAKHQSIPRLCREPALLQYGNLAKFGQQLKKLYEIFPAEQVLIIQFEDFCRTPQLTYKKVLHFLGLEDDGRSTYERVNDTQSLRGGILGLIARNCPVYVRNLVTKFRYRRGLRVISILLDNTFKTAKKKSFISTEFRARLELYFAEDQRLLTQIMSLHNT